ncbi:30S ribosomal protein S8 [Candidatus Kaiserbacteria bacterium RIFCSPHIGHO2_02_FULL_49_11]|uniref:Small ribosomal subunit protein uS8 n=1 Tax=Candidatus Kaiserbacteria bacterium RIFCSPHIGHO2_02_FULL_49_11 TaxID=1798489 RepID=A0A1F6CZF0_9BACT|nr:MAG: 30S ribosomal protein S8 [Candidatus Kaiserbacteria bacterium RIFCSPHIGHO2_02_FULL_49_11]
MVSDPIGDFIVRLKNASQVGKDTVAVPHSKLRLAVAEILEKKGYIKSINKKGKKTGRTIEVELKYNKDKTPTIVGVKRVSKPGRRIYQGAKDIRPVKYGKGLLVLSTPRGILGGEEARKENVGGEALFKIW